MASKGNPRLADAPSPYLRSAANQPVKWFPWGDEAFAEAKKRDLPILLDIGAVWCHWCHVMDHESYDDAEVAKILNEKFIPVKVDRDERPDVDSRYQKMVSAISGQGGWPLTGFLTPEGRVFYGGTYFPPIDAHGRPSFKRVLEAISAAWQNERPRILEQAGQVEHALHEHVESRKAEGKPLSAEAVTAAARSLESNYDHAHGGWGGAPKFPHPGALEFLIARLERGDLAARPLVEGALDGPARGGMRDHVGGGFHRYSVDAEWMVPHFEKMLYDNAELLRNHTHAFRVLGRGRDAAAAHETVRFLNGVLSDQVHGGFYGSQDADVGAHDDGDFFTWTEGEIHEAMGDPELAKLAVLRFGAGVRGEMHGRPGRYVLHHAADLEDLASVRKVSVEAVLRQIDTGLERLQAARAKRPAPFVDPVHYTNWNAMAIRAYFEYAAVLDRPAAASFALKTLDRFLREAYVRGKGFAHTLGAGSVRGLLDDHAQMLVALIAAFNHTQRGSYLDRAQEVGDLLLSEFLVEDGAGFRDVARSLYRAEAASPLSKPDRPTQDSPSPSANARAIEGLARLADLVPDGDRYRHAARKAIEGLWGEVETLGLFGGALLLAAQFVVDPPPKVVVAGPAAAAEGVKALRQYSLAHGPLGTQVLVANGAGKAVSEEVRAFVEGPARTAAGALVCVGTRCLAPASTPQALRERFRGLWPAAKPSG